MDLKDRIQSFVTTHRTTGWLLAFMAGGLILQFLIWLIFPDNFREIILNLTLPFGLESFVQEPWRIISLFTYPFFYSNFMIFLTLMAGMMLYTFGVNHQDFLGDQRTRRLVILGIPLIGLLTVCYTTLYGLFNLPPELNSSMINHLKMDEVEVYKDTILSRWGLHGVFPSGMWFIVALIGGSLISLKPTMQIPMMLLGSIQIRWLGLILFVLVLAFFSFFSPAGIGLIISAGLGYLHVHLLNRGIDVTEMIWSYYQDDKKPRMKVKHVNRNPQPSRPRSHPRPSKVGTKSKGPGKPEQITQDVIDGILDKISDSGIESLTREERELLFKAGEKKEDDQNR